MLGLGLSLTKALSVLKTIIRDGLRMWLPFEKSEILREELVVGDNSSFDTSTGDWQNFRGVMSWDSSIKAAKWTDNEQGSGPVGFTMIGGVIPISNGKVYRVKFIAKTDSSSSFNFGYIGEGTTFSTVTNPNLTSYFQEYEFTFTATGNNPRLYIGFSVSPIESGNSYWIDNVSFKEVTQIAPDKSGNSNNATLYTGKALSFDGVNDYVDFGSDVNNNRTVWTTAIWISNFTASSSLSVIYGRDNTRIIGLNKNGNVFFRVDTGTYYEFDCDVFNTSFTSAKRLVFTSDGTDIKLYLDGVYIDKVTPANTQLILQRLMAGYSTSAHLVDATVSDFQLYDVAWTQADVTFDYDNPQHLVTDRAASSIALSNLKGYWHLSEGAGSFAYNSAVALGSELVTNGDFNSSGSWGAGTGWTIDTVNGKAKVDYGTATQLTQSSFPVTNGKTYFVSFQISDYVSGSFQPQFGSGQVIASLSNNGVYRYTVTSSVTNPILYLYGVGDCEFSIDYISIKEVSVGTINGTTWSPRQATIPQLGLMDWSKPTIGSDVVTLISDPNDPSKDVLDNDVRLREHGLNLDGSGYAQVADDNSINPTSAITVACWVYWNETLSNGTNTNDIGIVSKWKPGTEDYMLYKGTDTTFDFWIGTDSERSNDLEMDTPGWVYIAGTYDGSTIKTYKNGVSNSSGTSVSRTIPNTAQVLEIGRYRETVNRSYPERIDEVKIYERALSADELLQNYNAGLSQHKPGSAFSDDFSSDYGL